MDSLFSDSAIFSRDVAFILGANALIIGGALLILVSLRAGDDVMRARFSLIGRVWDDRAAARRAAKAKAAWTYYTGPLADSVQREAARQLAKLGLAPERAPAVLLGIRLAGLAGLAGLAVFLAPHLGLLAGSPARSGAFVVLAGVFGWTWPGFVLRAAVRERMAKVVAGLPDALDLLVICAEAGLALESGISRVAEELELSQPELAEELSRTAADLKVLPSSEKALARLAERIDAPAVRALASTLSQTLHYGTPLAQAMRVVAAQMRNDALLQLEERANKLPALMTVPMIILIMPTIFLIVGGPAALKIIDILM
ncbi:type II secretion system F family protein [Hyphococcus luteus]|uniref:Type II secretion system protein n=1 Tax=Hyphococcus luteus TaxID=2058213 RepID=A0A2S7K5W6_9PROT|nr:type II secretion system F family protein [Marinicaulis flavus]PQA87882.1 type II secretion system protein [Marinicaulis flavus]